MIKADIKADRSIEIDISGSAADIISEAGALLGRAVGALAPMAAMTHSCSIREAERLILDDVRELAETGLQSRRHELEGGEAPPEQPQPPRRRRRIFGQTCSTAAVEQ